MALEQIDNLIFDHRQFGLQRCATWIQSWTGLTPVVQAKCVWVVGGGMACGGHLTKYTIDPSGEHLRVLVYVVIMVVYVLGVFVFLPYFLSKRTYIRNPFRFEQSMRLLRIVTICSIVTIFFGVGISYELLLVVSLWVALYLFACDSVPPPPKRYTKPVHTH